MKIYIIICFERVYVLVRGPPLTFPPIVSTLSLGSLGRKTKPEVLHWTTLGPIS